MIMLCPDQSLPAMMYRTNYQGKQFIAGEILLFTASLQYNL